jgi:LPS sulfotransferase NodH
VTTPENLVWAICTVARSGSSWLSQLIASTHRLGYPDEYLLEWPKRCAEWGLSPTPSFEQYLALVVRAKSTANGVFAVKGSVDEMTPFFSVFPQTPCVWLRRSNRLEQAISWYRAHDGKLWTRTSRTAARSISLPYSASRIAYFLQEIARREQAWEEFFRRRRSPPLTLIYEDLTADPAAAVHAIAQYLGVDATDMSITESDFRVVRDQTTRDWLARAAQDLGLAEVQPITS